MTSIDLLRLVNLPSNRSSNFPLAVLAAGDYVELRWQIVHVNAHGQHIG
jgi:hypothetical protein